MSSSKPSSSNSEPAPSREAGPPKPSWTTQVGFRLVRPPQGQYSPRTDERCFTYCSQSSGGRTDKQDPWCRSLCIRRVFAHEVQRIRTHEKNLSERSQDHAKYALPPEGQRSDEAQDGRSRDDSYERKLRQKDAQYWQEGWYLWYSTNRWAVQEKIDMMVHPLSVQADWAKHMAAVREEYEMKLKADPNEPMPTMMLTPPWILDPSRQSLLVHLPPTLHIFNHLEQLLAPTFKVTNIVRESLGSGAQKELAGRIWEKAWTGEPWLLARNVCSRMWKVWQDDSENDP
ncbi:hypothetical protein HWV62_36499 [Athelia sp. TMB]|nr:hypothetical protein HWV62_36499 [Athelia sp. TMB]